MLHSRSLLVIHLKHFILKHLQCEDSIGRFLYVSERHKKPHTFCWWTQTGSLFLFLTVHGCSFPIVKVALLEGSVISLQDSKHCSSLYLDRSGGGRVGVTGWCGERLIKSLSLDSAAACWLFEPKVTFYSILWHCLTLGKSPGFFFPPLNFFECWRRSLLSPGEFFFFFFFLNFGQGVQLAGFQFPHQGLNPWPWQWKHQILTTRPPGNPRGRISIKKKNLWFLENSSRKYHAE